QPTLGDPVNEQHRPADGIACLLHVELDARSARDDMAPRRRLDGSLVCHDFPPALADLLCRNAMGAGRPQASGSSPDVPADHGDLSLCDGRGRRSPLSTAHTAMSVRDLSPSLVMMWSIWLPTVFSEIERA